MIPGPGRRRILLALLTAPLLWAAYPGGGGLWPLLAVALLPFLVAVGTVEGKRTFLVGLLTGSLHFLLQLYWIVTVLERYGGLPLTIAVAALVLLAVYMACYWGIFACLARRALASSSLVVILVGVPALWVGLEWLRGVLFSGFPWMDIGYGLAGEPLLIQSADLFGHGSVSYLIVLVNVLATCWILFRGSSRHLIPGTVGVILVVGAVVGYNQMRWQKFGEGETEAGMVVGVVQGNIDQNEKWLPELQQRTLSAYLDLTRDLVDADHPELVVWPETALPFYPQLFSGTGDLYRLVDETGVALLSGAPWFVREKEQKVRYYNRAQLIEPGAGFTGSYDKSHLVPFGEYVPMRKWLPFLEPLVEAAGDFTPGRVAAPIPWRKARLGVLICFESIFPDIARRWSEKGANLLVNLTNDAWYGKSSAPYHSMAMTIFRAVETRKSVVRAANTGISGFIDPRGELHIPSPIFEPWGGVRRVTLCDGKTIFVRWGWVFPIFCLAVGLLLVVTQAPARGKR